MTRRINIENYQEVLHRLRLGQSIRQICKDTNIHRTIIRKVHKLALDRNWLDPAASLPSLRDIQESLNEAQTSSSSFSQLEMASNEIKAWLEKGYSKTVIHQLLKNRIPCSRIMVSRFICKKFPKSVDPVMLRSTKPGETADVDFGYLGVVYDEALKQNRKAWFFSCRLRHSRKTYREITLNQNEKTFFAAHIHAFEFFQGVPTKIVIDNLKAGVAQASLTDPVLNPSYKELAHHYGFIISPCAPYTPQHKGGVENDVKYVKHNFWPLFLEEQRQKGHQIPYLHDLREYLIYWNEKTAETRTITGVGRTVVEIFEEEEKSELRSLPIERWDPVEWKKAKVGLDWRIAYDGSYYSVPYQLIGQEVMICASDSVIRIFCERVEATCHIRATKKGEYARKIEHAPPQLEEVLNATRESLVIRAEKLGGYILIATMHLLTDSIQDQLNAVRRLLDLEKRYGQLRLEAACHRAVAYSTISYISIRKILEQELDQQSTQKDSNIKKAETYRFARSEEHYTF